jgi:hypothetical protein
VRKASNLGRAAPGSFGRYEASSAVLSAPVGGDPCKGEEPPRRDSDNEVGRGGVRRGLGQDSCDRHAEQGTGGHI